MALDRRFPVFQWEVNSEIKCSMIPGMRPQNGSIFPKAEDSILRCVTESLTVIPEGSGENPNRIAHTSALLFGKVGLSS